MKFQNFTLRGYIICIHLLMGKRKEHLLECCLTERVILDTRKFVLGRLHFAKHRRPLHCFTDGYMIGQHAMEIGPKDIYIYQSSMLKNIV